MKKINFYIVSLFALVLLFSMQSVAYGSGDKRFQDGRAFDREAFFAKRNAFLAAKIGLTTEESAVFIPLENELLRKKFEIWRVCRRIEHDLSDKKNKSEDDFKKLLKCKEEEKDKTDKLDKEYHEKFKKYLSAEKMLKYLKAEREFFYEDSFRGERKR